MRASGRVRWMMIEATVGNEQNKHWIIDKARKVQSNGCEVKASFRQCLEKNLKPLRIWNAQKLGPDVIIKFLAVLTNSIKGPCRDGARKLLIIRGRRVAHVNVHITFQWIDEQLNKAKRILMKDFAVNIESISWRQRWINYTSPPILSVFTFDNESFGDWASKALIQLFFASIHHHQMVCGMTCMEFTYTTTP